MMLPIHRLLFACALLGASALIADRAAATVNSGAPCAASCGDENEPFLAAATLVQPALLSGPDFKVVPEVQVRGYMANFLIDTPYGPLHADSVELLAVRVGEMPALAALDKAGKSDAFAHALAERGTKTGSAIVNVVSHPIATITGLPAGVVRYFKTKLDTWGHRAQSLADQTARHTENSGDPFRAPAGPMTANRDVAKDADPLHDEKKNRAWYARVGSETGRETRRYLKYAEQRRSMAKRLGIDPETTNPLINERLDALAWAAVGGNFSAGEALGAVTGTAATVIADSGRLNQYVLQRTPEQVRDALERRLLKLCSDDDAIRSFLRRGAFTNTLRAALVESLEELRPADGCNALLELAATTRSEVEARYLVDALKLIRQHVPSPPAGNLMVDGAAIAWHSRDGRVVLPLPVDLLSWSHDIGDFLDQPAFAVADKTVLIAGDATQLAQQGLTKRGWSLALHVPYDSTQRQIAKAKPDAP